MKSVTIENYRLVNLTPHSLNIVGEQGQITVIPPSGLVARVGMRKYTLPGIPGIPMWDVQEGELEIIGEDAGLDPHEEGITVILITSAMAKEAVRKEISAAWVMSPGDLVRDEKGQPTGCKGLHF